MGDLGDRLERIGLSQYLDVLVAEGFDTWETVLDITEPDLYVNIMLSLVTLAHNLRNSLNVKLGHRRVSRRRPFVALVPVMLISI